MEEIQEFPKMLYAHPVDKTKEHKFIVVNTLAESDDALSKGYKAEPHIPVPAPKDSYEVAYEVEEAPGSGSERWYGEGDDWTQSKGAGLTDDTSAVEPV